VRLRPLTEAEAYARCYGSGDDNVRTVKISSRRPRYDPSVSGEDLRQAFERKLDGRDHVEEPTVPGREPAAA
jgi:hypothetical protein